MKENPVPTSYALEQVDSSRFLEVGLPEPMPEVDEFIEFAYFRGQLDQIGLSSLLCILEMERKTGILVLILEPEGEQAHLHLSQGRVFRASLVGTKEPRNAELVYGLLARTRGTFDFRPSSVDLDDDLQCSTSRLIFEGARRIDEASLAPGSETIATGSLPVEGQDIVDLANRVPLEYPSAPCRGGPYERVPVDRGASEPGKGPDRTSSRKEEEGLGAPSFQEKRGSAPFPPRRGALAKAVVAALLMAGFALVVLTNVHRADPAAPDSISSGPEDPLAPFPVGPIR
jgi:hypothetical protein